jgi:hypothetical protein
MNPEEGNFFGVPFFMKGRAALELNVHRYKALHGDAGVSHYEIDSESIAVRFEDRSVYLYTYASTGKRQIETMKKLAVRGHGLTTYISQNVRDRYAAKLT